jgi:hypothetical protein
MDRKYLQIFSGSQKKVDKDQGSINILKKQKIVFQNNVRSMCGNIVRFLSNISGKFQFTNRTFILHTTHT